MNDNRIQLVINGYNKLDPQIDQGFSDLYSEFASRDIKSLAELDNLVKKVFPNFMEIALQYFGKMNTIRELQNDFINNFSPIANNFISHSKFLLAQRFWEQILLKITTIETSFRIRIHKGAILYYWGGIAIMNGELDKGYMLMHAALDEDITTYKKTHPGTPAERFVYLDYHDPNQHFLGILEEQGAFLESYLRKYNLLHGPLYTIDSFRDNFLSIHPKPDSIFLFAYTISRLERIYKTPTFSANNPFTGILDINILFDIILIIDSSIQAKSSVGWKFFNLARHLSDTAGLDLTQVRIENINLEQKRSGNFSNVVNQLIDGSFPLQDGHALSRLGSDIAIAFCIRNQAAHNISSQSLTPAKTYQLLQSLFNVLFLTAQTLYK